MRASFARRLFFHQTQQERPPHLHPARREPLKAIDERLTEEDFLAAYDTLRDVSSAFKIVAHLSEEARSLSPFMADMTCLVEDFRGADTTDELAMQLARRQPTWAFDVADFNIRVRLTHGELLNLNIGKQGVCVDDVLKATTNDARRPLRASLGCDEDLFLDSLSNFHFRTSKIIQQRSQSSYADSCQPPLMYWAAVAAPFVTAYMARQSAHHSDLNVMDDPKIVATNALKSFFIHEDAHVSCPILPMEDMNRIKEIAALRDLLRPKHPGFHNFATTWGKSSDEEDDE